MTLHRAESKPDWERLAKRRRNNWQQLAARTHGWLTPGNGLTFAGALLVVAGLVTLHSKLYLLSFVLIVVGRLCDLADGWVAHRTGTKSPLGEKLDAGMDKLLGLVALIALVAMHYFPLWAALVIIAVNLAISLPSLLSMVAGRVIHPSRTGKLAMAAAWAAMFSYLLAANFDGVPGALLRLLGVCFVVITTGLALLTVADYAAQYRALHAR